MAQRHYEGLSEIPLLSICPSLFETLYYREKTTNYLRVDRRIFITWTPEFERLDVVENT